MLKQDNDPLNPHIKAVDQIKQTNIELKTCPHHNPIKNTWTALKLGLWKKDIQL